ncbi:MAG: EAL domain-containing protein [Thiocapsa sp.]|nr:EAL domain-containing protein [Thiocapsa sp.]MCG6896011.1 EAL domain-containing protein [Thiocapsa sp.]
MRVETNLRRRGRENGLAISSQGAARQTGEAPWAVLALEKSRRRFQRLVEDIGPNYVIYSHRDDGIVEYATKGAEHIFGISLERLIGSSFELIPWLPASRESAWANIRAMMVTGETPPRYELQFRRPDGGIGTVAVISHPVRGENGLYNRVEGIVEDITERKRTEDRLREAASVFSHAREGVVIAAPNGDILDVNDAFTKISGYRRDEVIGRNPKMLGSDRRDRFLYEDMWRGLTEHGHWTGEILNRRKDGKRFVALVTISAVHDDRGQLVRYVAIYSDITAIKEHQRQLEYIAHFDVLTGLPNRVLLSDRLQQAMVRAERTSRRLGVVYVDLDGFKVVNDTYGHAVGDRLLPVVAEHMQDALREGDTLARLGGDEFVAVLPDLTDTEACLPILDRLLGAAARAMRVDGEVLRVTASLGVTFYPGPEKADADQLLRQADQAMYQAKVAGRNRYHIFDAEHDRALRRRYSELERIRQGMLAGELVLHYQPRVRMLTGEVVGVEALLRWRHPQRGFVLPAEVLSIIDGHPLAVELGNWVLDTVLDQLETWRSNGLSLPVSVNVAVQQLRQGDFLDRLRSRLAAHPGVEPGDLELEIVEATALQELALITPLAQACRGLGVAFALDDFGSGYSSLTCLRRLPVHRLNVHQGLVRDLLNNPDDQAILQGVLSLAATLHRQVIVEGVETRAHGELLLRLGCDLAQGFAIARPMPADELPVWLAAWRCPPSWLSVPAERLGRRVDEGRLGPSLPCALIGSGMPERTEHCAAIPPPGSINQQNVKQNETDSSVTPVDRRCPASQTLISTQ